MDDDTNLDEVIGNLSDGTGKQRTDYTQAFEAAMRAICVPTPGVTIHTAYMEGEYVRFTMIMANWHRWYAIAPKPDETPEKCAERAYFTMVIAPAPLFTEEHIQKHLKTAQWLDPDLIPTMQDLYPDDWQVAVAEGVIVMQGDREFDRMRYIGGVEVVKGAYIFTHKRQTHDA